MSRQYSIGVLGQHIGSIWADSHELVDLGRGLPSFGLMKEGVDGYVAVLAAPPGIALEWRDEGDLNGPYTVVNSPAATQSEDCATAQPDAE